MKSDYRHPRRARVRTGAEYERVFKTGKRAALPAAALHWRPLDAEVSLLTAIGQLATDVNGDTSQPTAVFAMPSAAGVHEPAAEVSALSASSSLKPAAPPTARLGLAVSRKVDPDAVGRNRIKRVWRDAFRQLRTELPVADYVLVARPPCRQLDNAALRALLWTLLRRAGALPPPGTPVTLVPAAPDLVLHASAPTPSDSVPAPASAEPLRP